MTSQTGTEKKAGKAGKYVREQKEAFPCLPQEKARKIENDLKQRYHIEDHNSVDGKGYRIRDRTNKKELFFSPNSRQVLETRYLEKDSSRNVVETVLDLFARVAVNIATADQKYSSGADIGEQAEIFLEMMLYRDFMPNTPTLCNAGRPLQQLSACFVLPVEDYMATDDIGADPEKQGEGIYDGIRYAAMIHKSGGGTGFNFSHLRPCNDHISTTFGTSSGPVSFIKTYDASTQAVNQGGFRRGANMGIMEYWHPDIFQFIHEKRNGTLKNFNLSVGVDDSFMKLVTGETLDRGENGGYFHLINPKSREKVPKEERTYKVEELLQVVSSQEGDAADPAREEYLKQRNELDPSLLLDEDGETVLNRYSGEEVGKINEKEEVLIHAGALFSYLVDSAWTMGCPGLLFFDTINRDNPTPHIGRIEATNPCGEQPLLPFEACNLGAVNLSNCIRETEDGPEVDFEKIEDVVKKGVHFLDNVVDMSRFPLRKIYQMVTGNRKIGLGMMGWAELLFAIGVPYDSQEALELAERVSSFITKKARKASKDLASERGEFPNWKGSVYDPDSEFADNEKAGLKVRNAAVTTIAPNGTTGMIADTSGGIEPVFSLYYEKKCMDGRRLKYKVKPFEETLKDRDLLTEELLSEVQFQGGRVNDISRLPDDIRNVFKTAHDISPEFHVKMQAAFQSGIDNAVSKTVNLPFEAAREDIAEIYINAWKLGCKGITVFRDRSRDDQVLHTGAAEPEFSLVSVDVTPPEILEVAAGASKYTVRRTRNRDTLHIIVRDRLYVDDRNSNAYLLPYEVFCERAPIGASQSVDFQMDGLDRSVILRAEDPDYAEQIIRWKSPSTAEEEEGLGPRKIKSKHHAFGIALEHHLLSRGIVAYDAAGNLFNVIRKKDLREATPKEQKKIRNSNSSNGGRIKQNIAGNVVLGSSFECGECGSTEYFFESGCHSPKCVKCGWSDGDCG